MYRQHTLRNTTAFLITALACVHNAAHAALELVTIDTKQQEVKEKPTIPQPPKELRAAVSTYIGPSDLQTIIYDYLRGSEIHEDHARLLRFINNRFLNPKQECDLLEFKCIYDYWANMAPTSHKELPIDDKDKKWVESYIVLGFQGGLKKIKQERDTKNNFFEYGFENFIILQDKAYIQEHNKNLLEYLLSNCGQINDRPAGVEIMEKVVTLLIENKAAVNAYLEEQSMTPLRAAIDNFKNPKLVQLMLEHKADPNYRCGFNKYGNYSSYLHQVNEAWHPLIVQLLLDAKADPLQIQRLHTHPEVLVTPLALIKGRASFAREKAQEPGATLDDGAKAEKLELFAKMFEDAARASQKHLKKDAY